METDRGHCLMPNLVSDVVKQTGTGKDFDFEDRGLVELKGFDEPVRAWAVRRE